MTKEPKKTTYVIEPLVKILRSEASSDGGTQKKAEALEGTWIRLNEYEHVFEEEHKVTRVYSDGKYVGCACGRCGNGVLCEHSIAFEDLKSPPQLTIESPDYRWLRTYLMSLKWYPENRYLYPPMGAEVPEDEASWAPDEEESTKLDPVNEDHDLDIGVDEEPELKTYSRKCVHCGDVISGTDLEYVKHDIAEHTRNCPKNPANKKKEAPKPEQEPVVKESLTTETQSDEEHEMDEETKMYEHPDGTEFETAEALLDYVVALKAEQDMRDTKALMTSQESTTMQAQAWSDDQIEVMKKTVAEKATPAEFAYFLNVAKYSGLNPFLREIYFMKTDKGQTAIITGRDGYLTIAKRDHRFKGIQSMEDCARYEFEMGIDDGMMKVVKHDITNFVDRGDIIGAWARGEMRGQDPVTVFVSIKEYDKGGNIWNRYKSAMIRKVAESMVLKRIAGISGLMTEAEVSESKDMIIDAEVL